MATTGAKFDFAGGSWLAVAQSLYRDSIKFSALLFPDGTTLVGNNDEMQIDRPSVSKPAMPIGTVRSSTYIDNHGLGYQQLVSRLSIISRTLTDDGFCCAL